MLEKSFSFYYMFLVQIHRCCAVTLNRTRRQCQKIRCEIDNMETIKNNQDKKIVVSHTQQNIKQKKRVALTIF